MIRTYCEPKKKNMSKVKSLRVQGFLDISKCLEGLHKGFLAFNSLINKKNNRWGVCVWGGVKHSKAKKTYLWSNDLFTENYICLLVGEEENKEGSTKTPLVGPIFKDHSGEDGLQNQSKLLWLTIEHYNVNLGRRRPYVQSTQCCSSLGHCISEHKYAREPYSKGMRSRRPHSWGHRGQLAGWREESG